jgi:hypothetical protein
MVYFGLLVYSLIFNQDVGIKIAKKGRAAVPHEVC